MEERMKALQDRQEKNRFTQLSHIEISSALEQGVVCTMEIFPECTNHLGFVHAGALYTLAENAAGAAAFHFDGRRYVTQGGNIHYLGNQKSGVLRAEARVVHRGNSTALVRTEVTGENGKLICTGEFSFFCIDR
ncbi:MAG: PaaI family thioesterase [Oscillibacter sp.]|nr:PaaI family thioesterase [Oscillibacter sp.]